MCISRGAVTGGGATGPQLETMGADSSLAPIFPLRKIGKV
jgi:hypothetical protein